MLIPNCLFRSNGSAVLLSNRGRDAARSKYRIANIVRTNLAADDVAFNCVMQTEDDEGKVGCVGFFCRLFLLVWLFSRRNSLAATWPRKTFSAHTCYLLCDTQPRTNHTKRLACASTRTSSLWGPRRCART